MESALAVPVRPEALPRRCLVLRHLSSQRLRLLLRAASERAVGAGTVLFREGDEARSVFVIAEGYVRVSKAVAEGPPVRIATRGPRELVGELSIEPGSRRSATATAESRLRLIEIPRRQFVAALRDEPEAALALLRLVSERLRESDSTLVESVRKRTADLLATNDRLGAEVRRLREPGSRERAFDEFVGSSVEASRVRKAAAMAARSDRPVLLVGEPGVGRHLLARLIHASSGRSRAPFVELDAALLAEETSEGLIFGHAPGALAGATRAEAGSIADALGGTLYIESIDRLSVHAQAQVVRLLNVAEYCRVGESRVRQGDVRLIASTDHDPQQALREGRLRGDLLAQLEAFRITVPPLRSRRRDIAPLVLALSERCANQRGIPLLRFGAPALRVLAFARLEGNARELEAEIERLYSVLEPGVEVAPGDLHLSLAGGSAGAGARYGEALRSFKSHLIGDALRAADGETAAAAERLGLHPSNLLRTMRDLGLDRPSRGGR
jgi:DNA-binding NtrC family response regulator